MSEKRKSPWWIKLITSLVSVIFSFVLIVGAVCVFVKIKYDVNIFETGSQLITLTKQVDENKKYTNMFVDSNMEDASTAINLIVPNFITYSESDGYKINDSASGLMSDELRLTDKQVGALINTLLKNQEVGGFKIMGKEMSFQLIQISFNNILSTSVELNSVVKVDFSSIKENMTSFPLNIINKYIPNGLYFSSTIIINKGENPFEYTITSKSLEINNLSSASTTSLLKTINTFINVGNAEELNLTIGGSFANAIIGNSEVNGFAYSLRDFGATDYAFEIKDDTNYFVIKK